MVHSAFPGEKQKNKVQFGSNYKHHWPEPILIVKLTKRLPPSQKLQLRVNNDSLFSHKRDPAASQPGFKVVVR